MAGSVLDHPSVRVGSDPASATWSLVLGDRGYRVREWTWGERRHLVDSCVRGSGFDRERFVVGLVDLVVSPTPRAEETPVLAAAALRLLGVDPSERPAPLLASEAVLASAWGWGPAQLDPQPASRIDRHLAGLSVPSAETAGWHRIEVIDD